MTEASAWSDAALAAHLFAVDPPGTGASLRARAGTARDRWLALLDGLLPSATPARRIPLGIGDDRLLGGLELAATLRAGRPIVERGILAASDGGVALLAMAERHSPAIVGRIVATIDSRSVAIEREGMTSRHPARIGFVALDEGDADDERPAGALLDRLAFWIDLNAARDEPNDAPRSAVTTEEARALLPSVTAADAIVSGICRGASALGIDSIRTALLTLRVARIHAAYLGRASVTETDAAVAARLVLAPRATVMPPAPADDRPTEPARNSNAGPREEQDEEDPSTGRDVGEIVVAAARAAVPADLLSHLSSASSGKRGASDRHGAGLARQDHRRGRPVGARRGNPRGGARLHVLETLRAAAPWQGVRRAASGEGNGGGARRIEVRREDFRVFRFEQPSETTTIFAVDASGSAAMHRLGEVKGAIELLLADCYVRRERVALVAFRQSAAGTLLAPTRSLARAKRSLADLPGGGGTPLAAGIEAATCLAETERRQGRAPIVVLLTDGQANVARDGTADRPRAEADALAAARMLGAARIDAILIDAAPRPRPATRALAAAMAARYVPLPQADAGTLAAAVRAAA